MKTNEMKRLLHTIGRTTDEQIRTDPSARLALRRSLDWFERSGLIRKVTLAGMGMVLLAGPLSEAKALDIYQVINAARTVTDPYMSKTDKAIITGGAVITETERIMREKQEKQRREEERKRREDELARQREPQKDDNAELRKEVRDLEERAELERRKKEAQQKLDSLNADEKTPAQNKEEKESVTEKITATPKRSEAPQGMSR
jgi:septal ring factor EnvC (AmiA/AmiB activator)